MWERKCERGRFLFCLLLFFFCGAVIREYGRSATGVSASENEHRLT